MHDPSPFQRLLSNARNRDRLRDEFAAACKAASDYPFKIGDREDRKAAGYPVDGEVEQFEGRTWWPKWAELILAVAGPWRAMGGEELTGDMPPDVTAGLSDDLRRGLLFAVVLARLAAQEATAQDLIDYIGWAAEKGISSMNIGRGLERLPELLAVLHQQKPLAAEAEPAAATPPPPLPPPPPPPAEQYVTMDQAAAIVNRSKSTLERLREKMPDPDVEGGGGKSHEWRWSRIRPWLEREFGKLLPVKFPSR
jgi:hypothetical protein